MLKKIQQLIPDTKDTFAFFGETGTTGTPVKVRFFALYTDGSVSAFVINRNSLVQAESMDDFLYLGD